MRWIWSSPILLLLLVSAAPLWADPWKDESGHGRRHGGEWKEEYRDGNCKIERKGGRGGYKEEIKCDGPRYVEPRPVYVDPPPVVVVPAIPDRVIIDIPIGR